jgi:RNA polymerase sigma-70 factor (ECF subfamily)
MDTSMNNKKIHTEYLDCYDTYADSIYRFLAFQTNNKPTAEDLTQDTFIKLWDYLQKNEKKVENMKAFVFRIARNTLIDFRRKKKATSLDNITDTGVDFKSEEDILDETILQDDFKYIISKLEILSEKEKQLILLRYVENMSVQEIATIYKKRPNTLSVTIHRALEKIKKHL